MNISNNITSIQSQQSLLNESARAIANINTSSDSASISQGTQADLAQEIPKQIIAQGATEVNVTAIKTADEMLGSLLDIKA